VSILGAIGGVVSALLINEFSDVCPWLARKVVRWSARVQYADRDRAQMREEELEALVDARPGKLFKLLTAAWFGVVAVRSWLRIIVAGIRAAGPSLSLAGTVALTPAVAIIGLMGLALVMLASWPAAQDPGSRPAAQQPRIQTVSTVSAEPGDGTQFSKSIAVAVTDSRPLPAGGTYWLMVQFAGGPSMVYKAEGKVPAGQGTFHFSISIAGSAVGSERTIYVLEAGRQATTALAQNFDNQAPVWDGNRTSLPPGVAAISNSVTVKRAS
jgi:hypothetical protein